MSSHRPYLLRALYEWIVDNGRPPHVLVDARMPACGTRACGKGRPHRPQHRRTRGIQARARQRCPAIHRALRRRQPGGHGAAAGGDRGLCARDRTGMACRRAARRHPPMGPAGDSPPRPTPRRPTTTGQRVRPARPSRPSAAATCASSSSPQAPVNAAGSCAPPPARRGGSAEADELLANSTTRPTWRSCPPRNIRSGNCARCPASPCPSGAVHAGGMTD